MIAYVLFLGERRVQFLLKQASFLGGLPAVNWDDLFQQVNLSLRYSHYLLYSFSQRRHKCPPRFPIDRLTTSPLVSKERLGHHLWYDCRSLERRRICTEALLKQIFPLLWDEPHLKAVKISMPIFILAAPLKQHPLSFGRSLAPLKLRFKDDVSRWRIMYVQ